MRFPEALDLRTYGQQLLAGREAKGWTQKQLSEKLLLPIYLIRAMEAGENGILPEIPYVMSMYRKLATAVDIDPEPMIQACQAFQVREGQPLIHQPESSPRTAPPPGQAVRTHNLSSGEPTTQRRKRSTRKAEATPQHTPQREAPASPPASQSKDKGDWVIVLVGCGLGLALVAVVLLNSELWPTIRSRLITTDPDAEAVAEPQDQASELPANQSQLITGTVDGPLESSDGPLEQQFEELEPGNVRFSFAPDVRDDISSWIRLENARGVLLFDGIPEPFTKLDLPIEAGIRVRVGRPGLVRWQQPGQPPQTLPQSDGWIELIPSSVAGQVAPVVPEPGDAEDPEAVVTQ